MDRSYDEYRQLVFDSNTIIDSQNRPTKATAGSVLYATQRDSDFNLTTPRKPLIILSTCSVPHLPSLSRFADDLEMSEWATEVSHKP